MHVFFVLLTAKQNYHFLDDAVSVTSSSMLDLDEEDEDLRVAASHLNQDLPGDGDEPRDEEQQEAEVEEGERDSRSKRPSLEALLGPLPTAASLGLSDSINKCVGEEKENENGEERPVGEQDSHKDLIV